MFYLTAITKVKDVSLGSVFGLKHIFCKQVVETKLSAELVSNQGP